jgi:hypothetical protein
MTLWQRAQEWWRGITVKQTQPANSGSSSSANDAEISEPCCNQAHVHIAYRGKSDDHMYMAYNRTWQEVRYFQPNGLRVFCAVCRRRLL